MNAVCVKSDSLEDWYTIERAEHDGKFEMRPTEYGASLYYAGRICDADVEGTSEEMLTIAKAIRDDTSVSFRRCAAIRVIEGYELCSPRNSQESALLTEAEADALADSIFNVINTTNQPERT